MRRLRNLPWPVIVVIPSALLLGMRILPAGRSPTGDAPLLLGRARRIVQEFWSGEVLAALGHLLGQVTPQPPAGFLLPAAAYGTGLERAAPLAAAVAALAIVAAGIRSLFPGEPGPTAAWLLLLATPMTWAAAEHLQWDLLAAAAVAATIGALARGHRAAGALAGLSLLVKYAAGFFLFLPCLFALVGHLRARRWAEAGWLAGGAALPLLLWLPLAAGSLAPYLADSLAAQPVDSAHPVPALAERLLPEHLSYYPAVLKDALGWPGLGFLLLAPLALRRGGALPLIAALSGLIVLSLIGRREPRYLYPALPLLLACAELGRRALPWRAARLAALALMLLAGGAQLAFTARAYGPWPDPRPLSNLDFGPANLARWGRYPAPEIPFVPTSASADLWQVDRAVAAIGKELGGPRGAVGLLLYENPRVPEAELLTLYAAAQGQRWDAVELSLRSASRAPPPPPPAGQRHPDPGAPRPPGAPPPLAPEDESFLLLAAHVPFPSAAQRVDLLYAIHPRGEPFYGAFLLQTGAARAAEIPLPYGFVGSLYRLPPELWERPLGQQLQRAITEPGVLISPIEGP